MTQQIASTTIMLEEMASAESSGAWSAFDDRYRPILIGVLRRLGFDSEDASDLTQEVLLRFVNEHQNGGLERNKGSLRSWLVTVARNLAIDLRRQRGAAGVVNHPSILDRTTDERVFHEAFDAETKDNILMTALDILKRGSEFQAVKVKAFELYALNGRSAGETATELGISVDAVYQAKHHCLARLKELSVELREAYELE